MSTINRNSSTSASRQIKAGSKRVGIPADTKSHLNYMAGTSFDINNPITRLRVAASSCFFGEPKYYERDKAVATPASIKRKLNDRQLDYLRSTLNAIDPQEWRGMTPTQTMESAIDAALNFDPEATLREAVRLRGEDNMRATPQVIMVRAANHEKVRGTSLIREYGPEIMKRTDDAVTQLAYQMECYGKPIPNSLKKAWSAFLQGKNDYDLAKYRMENREYKLVDLVNLVHAKSDSIAKLMKGELKLDESMTWEALISAKGSSQATWTEAVELMGHMALLRNLRNFVQHGVDPDAYLEKLKSTAKNGKQLPFRYYSAYKSLSGAPARVLDAVEECLKISLDEQPRFKGRVMSLCDNSGSAQGATTSSMGTMQVNQIANLTAVLTAYCADEGHVGVFGDRLETFEVRKTASILDQVKKADSLANGIGQSTENGIWLFFDKAIKEKQHWDHIFVYSDMQAGHGGLYGVNESQYKDYKWDGGRYIDVPKLIAKYRETVNPDVQVYLVQVAGYQDALVPEFYKRTYILGGWGDGLLKFAHAMSQLEDGVKQDAPAVQEDDLVEFAKKVNIVQENVRAQAAASLAAEADKKEAKPPKYRFKGGKFVEEGPGGM